MRLHHEGAEEVERLRTMMELQVGGEIVEYPFLGMGPNAR